jgi:hypothetical protein
MKNKAAVALGRLGGLKRASRMSKQQLSDSARKAAKARHDKRREAQ